MATRRVRIDVAALFTGANYATWNGAALVSGDALAGQEGFHSVQQPPFEGFGIRSTPSSAPAPAPSFDQAQDAIQPGHYGYAPVCGGLSAVFPAARVVDGHGGSLPSIHLEDRWLLHDGGDRVTHRFVGSGIAGVTTNHDLDRKVPTASERPIQLKTTTAQSDRAPVGTGAPRKTGVWYSLLETLDERLPKPLSRWEIRNDGPGCRSDGGLRERSP